MTNKTDVKNEVESLMKKENTNINLTSEKSLLKSLLSEADETNRQAINENEKSISSDFEASDFDREFNKFDREFNKFDREFNKFDRE
jgi:hypothetical protein